MKPLSLFLLAFIALQAVPASSEDEPMSQHIHRYLHEKNVVIVGAAWQKADAVVRATVDPFPEQGIDLEQLGVDPDYASYYLEWRHRFSQKWGLVAAAQTFQSDGDIVAQRDFNFGGVEFPAGIDINTELSVDIYFIDLMYHAYSSDRAEVSIGGGLHAFDTAVDISGKLFIGEGEFAGSGSSGELLAPLPNLRASAFYAFTDRLSTFATLGWLSADVDEWSGSFTYLHARFHYAFTERWGSSLGYQYTDVDVTRDRGRRETAFDMQFRGPTLQLTYLF
ncbi:hypothetical protein EY643_17145 [Halioglobus maricola]|uniref:Outer membrane protein beta-barrel domain-containing protein n=1 Tax=Halioglobus maricola TaxID=2601894 RepID=A0A5P9NP74_9GAMM|nr:hypothetical protein [Halioglobus maricola]QFU77245.1 hypothetical protein EY643_17145 [Halioglobus maricola]